RGLSMAKKRVKATRAKATKGDLKEIRPGDTNKADPFTIVVISNPALEAPWKSGNFLIDPITSDQPGFDGCVAYIDNALFGNLPNQSERLFADPAIGPRIRVVSLFTGALPA